VQFSFMTAWVVDAYAHVQRLVSVAKMATVLVVCTIEEQHLLCLFGGGGKRTHCRGYS
jgi:hypothetical protein